MRLLAVPLALGAIVMAGCSSVTPEPTRTESPPARVDLNPAAVKDLDAAVRVTDSYWSQHWSEFFPGAYSSPTVVGLYDGRDEDAPQCDGRPLSADNAYYCPEQDFVAWDIGIVAAGYEFGDAWAYLVVAHEWGHAIQARLGQPPISPNREQEADCLAGATLVGATADGALQFGASDRAEIAAAFEEVASPRPNADYGSAAARMAAFDRGALSGVLACFPSG